MKVALDTNILAYAEGVNGASMQKKAGDLVDRLPRDATYLPVQTLGELFYVLIRKAKKPPEFAHMAITDWSNDFPLIETTSSAFSAAVDLAVSHQLHIWDAVIIATAAKASCRLLLSEDMQDGFTWNGLTVTNPFLSSRNPLLDAFLDSAEKKSK